MIKTHPHYPWAVAIMRAHGFSARDIAEQDLLASQMIRERPNIDNALRWRQWRDDLKEKLEELADGSPYHGKAARRSLAEWALLCADLSQARDAYRRGLEIIERQWPWAALDRGAGLLRFLQ